MLSSSVRWSSILSLLLLIPALCNSQDKANSVDSNLFPLMQSGFFSIAASPDSAGEKSTGQAFLKSFLLPGWGELSAGDTKRARSFLIAEGLLWSAFAAFQIYGNWKRNDLENFAVERAGVNATGKPKSFYTDVSNFVDIYEHNEEMRRFRRYENVYPVDEDHSWSWAFETDRQRFDELRLSSSQALRNATLMLGVVFTNHVISAIDAIYVTRRSNKRISTQISVHPSKDSDGDLRINLALSANW